PGAARPRRRAARPRPGPHRHVLGQGLRAADDLVPRLLRLLHVPPRSGRARGPHDGAGRGGGARTGGRPAGREGSAVLARRQARGLVREPPRVSPAARAPPDPVVSPRRLRGGPRGVAAPAPRQPWW